MTTDAQAALAQVRKAIQGVIEPAVLILTTNEANAILAHVEAQKAEIERLTAALKYEQHRAERQGTHGEGCADWGPAHYECAIRQRDDLRRQLDEAEQRFDWLTTRLEDVQIDDADPNDHYYGDEEDVPYPVLWRRAIDAAMRLTRPAEEL